MTNHMTTEDAAELERRFEEFDPGSAAAYESPEEEPPDLALLRAQARRALYERQADEVMSEAIRNARSRGLSWRKIGLTLGTTGEAARQRYAVKL